MKKRVIVIGGGFGGLQFIRRLKRGKYSVMLIDRINHHQFQPLFYQVATSQIEPTSVTFPLRKVFHGRPDVSVRLAEVYSVDSERKVIATSAGEFPYDYLVIATGGKTNYYGNEELARKTLSLKSTFDAMRMRNIILENFEKILNARNEEESRGLFNIVVVGGGPTGVELAGAFAEIKRDVLPRDFHDIDFSRLNVYLVEGGKSTLSTMSRLAQKSSLKYLTKMGVIVRTGLLVKSYDGVTVTLSNGEKLESRNVVWTAGITGNSIGGLPEGVMTPSGRIRVDRYNRAECCNDIYAIGDIAWMETPKYPKGHPQVANVAINQGRNLAHNFNIAGSGRKMREYEYRDLGSMATVGRNKAIVDLPFISFHGYLAWYFWMFLHLMLILSVRNKLIIFINWAWNYISKNSSLRLILKLDHPEHEGGKTISLPASRGRVAEL